MHPQKGIAVFEVKDWNLSGETPAVKGYQEELGYSVRRDSNARIEGLEYIKRNGERIPVRDPFKQLELYKKEIVEIYASSLRDLGSEGNKNAWCSTCCGIIFTKAKKEQVTKQFEEFLVNYETKIDKNNDEIQIKKSLENKTYFTISGYDTLEGKDPLKEIYPWARDGCSSKFMNKEIAEELRGWLHLPENLIGSSDIILNPHQKILAESRSKSGYRRIRGAAGSGKTLVLTARAANLAAEGKSVLVLSYNITLWHYLYHLTLRQLKIRQKGWSIWFSHFHYFCRHQCYYAGEERAYSDLWKYSEDNAVNDILNLKLPLLTKRLLDEGRCRKWDAILVDEGQDLSPDWWQILRKALNPDGEMILCADMTQDLYEKRASWTDEAMSGCGFSGPWAELKTTYRLPRDFVSCTQGFAKKYLDKPYLPQKDPQGEMLDKCQMRWVQCDDERAIASVFIKELKEMRRLAEETQGLSFSDIVCLVPTLKLGKDLVDELRIEEMPEPVHTFGSWNTEREEGEEKQFSQQEVRRQKIRFFAQGSAWFQNIQLDRCGMPTAGNAIKYDRKTFRMTTPHSFKGWESSLLIVVIESCNLEIEKEKSAIYVALTRLRRREGISAITVICAEPLLKDYAKTWREFEGYVEEDSLGLDIPF